MASSYHEFVVAPDQAGARLDQFLAEQVPELSRGAARRLIDLGGVHLDGRRVRRCGEILAAGRTVRLHLDAGGPEPFVLEPARILYRDAFLLALDKPAGVETQPTPARYKGTVYSALADYLQDPFRRHQRPQIGMVQRLDRETSGVMVFSIHQRAHRGLTRAFAERRVDKSYLALVAGVPLADEGEFHSQLARSRQGNRMRSVARGGRQAITRYRVVERFAAAALVEIRILTGRSHQIRVHFAEAGHPLLGDRKYGGDPAGAGDWPRQMLHAARLELEHPVTGEPLSLEAPLPGDLRRALDRLRAKA